LSNKGDRTTSTNSLANSSSGNRPDAQRRLCQ